MHSILECQSVKQHQVYAEEVLFDSHKSWGEYNS